MFGRRKREKVKKPGFFGVILASLSALVSSTLIVLMTLMATDKINLIPEYVTVTFKGDNEEVLQVKEVLEFNAVKYDGPTPFKAPDEDGFYLFYGWDKPLFLVYKDTVTNAKFFKLGFDDLEKLADLIGELPPIDLSKLPKFPVMKIKTPMPGFIHLRTKSSGDYVNSSWQEAPQYSGKNAGNLFEIFENPVNFTGAVTAQHSPFPPMPLEITYLKNFDHTPVPEYSTCHLFDSNSDSYYGNEFGKGDTYKTDYFLMDPIHFASQFDTLRNLPLTDDQRYDLTRYKKYANEKYLTVNSTLKPLIKDIVREDGIKSSDSNVYKMVNDAINNRLKFDALKGRGRSYGVDPLVKALKTTHIGDARMFATLATQIFRYLNIPARYTSGYLGVVPPNMANQECEVSSFALWSWCEVFVDNVGWVAIETSLDGAMKTYGEDFVPGENGEFEPGDPEEYDPNDTLDENDENNNGSGDGEGNGNGNGKALTLNATLRKTKKIYDGKPFIPEDIIVFEDETIRDLAKYGLEAKFTSDGLDKFVTAGKKFFDFKVSLYKDGVDVTNQWNVVHNLTKLTIEIQRRKLNVRFLDKTILYDEKPHGLPPNIDEVNEFLKLTTGDIFTYDETKETYIDYGEYIFSGNIECTKIYNKDNEDVTSSYEISFTPGILTID